MINYISFNNIKKVGKLLILLLFLYYISSIQFIFSIVKYVLIISIELSIILSISVIIYFSIKSFIKNNEKNNEKINFTLSENDILISQLKVSYIMIFHYFISIVLLYFSFKIENFFIKIPFVYYICFLFAGSISFTRSCKNEYNELVDCIKNSFLLCVCYYLYSYLLF